MPCSLSKTKGPVSAPFTWMEFAETLNFICDEITLFIALKIEQAAKISMVKLDCHFGQQQGLALKCHAHAGGLQHRQIICPIANGRCINRINAVLLAIMRKIGGFGVAIENRRLNCAQNFAHRAHAYDWRDGYETRKARRRGR